MHTLNRTIVVALLIATCAAAEPALAQHRGHSWHARPSVGLYLGGPFYGPAYYPPRYVYPPYYPGYYSPTIVVPSTPPVYVENPQVVVVPNSALANVTPNVAPLVSNVPAVPAAPPGQWWYFCTEANAYYPTVADCPSPWRLVAPQPPTSEVR